MLGLALFGDLLDETIGEGHRMRQNIYLSKYTMMPPKQKKANFTHAVWRMLKAGEIERITKNQKPYLRITSYGKKKMIRDFSLLKMSRSRWRQKWCLVIFDIEESKKNARERLRRKLIELGFGQWQRSVYVSPYDFSNDLAEYLDKENLLGNAYVVTCRHQLMGDPLEFATKIWPISELNDRYLEIYEQLQKLKNSPNLNHLKKVRKEYHKVMANDPFLPKELLPKNWFGEKVQRTLGL